MLSDIEIAQKAKMLPIAEVAEKLGLAQDDLEFYGKYKAKISQTAGEKLKSKKNGKLILVTAINPTPAGEGKTTVSVGLSQAFYKLNKKAVLALREPSLGPVFGIKGGAAGGGYAQAVPMEDINLHFTGDMHAITSANNLLCALIDNHIHQGNALSIDPRTIVFKRCLDMNDRALRNIVIGLGGPVNGIPREDGFIITVASEIMAILCLAEDIDDLKDRFSKILIGYTYDKKPVFAGDLNAQGAMAALMKDAINPNLVQTLENTPVLIHGGPFANIAHGCNSVKATKLALKLGDYAITEAGFGSDLGAEKFFDIKCRYANISPDCVVLVATVRALKYNGGVKKSDLSNPNIAAIEKGIENLKKHIANMKNYGVHVVVALNKFHTDSEEEIDVIKKCCENEKCEFAICEVFQKGGEGGTELVNKVVNLCERPNSFKFLYENELSLEQKMEKIATEIYGASHVTYSDKARKQLDNFVQMGYDHFPVCVAKTQYSLSADPSKLGRPSGFVIPVNEVRLAAGAGFVIMLTGNIMTMPGLPKQPAALSIDVVDEKIQGLF